MAGPLPPLVGGMATVIHDVSQSSLCDETELALFNTSKVNSSSRSLLGKLASQVMLWRDWWYVLGHQRNTIAHIHTCSGLSFLLDGILIVLAKLKGCPAVLHIHGGRFDQFLDGLSGRGLFVARWIAKRATKIVVLSEQWQEKLSTRLNVFDLVVIENGVPVPENCKNYDGDKKNITVFFLGSLSKQKGVFDLLDAIQGTDAKVNLVIAGNEGSLGIGESIHQKISNYGLNARVQCVGSVVGEEKRRYFQLADIFVLPSYIEGLPISLLEAMCFGLPVITTPVGGIPSVVLHDETGLLVQPGDVQGLRDAIKTLSDDATQRQRLGVAARKLCIKNYGIETVVRQYLKLYNTISYIG